MNRTPPRTATLIPVFLGFILCTMPTSAQDEQRVRVTNFPSVQTVDGTLKIDGPIAQTRLRKLKAAAVAPVGPKETAALVLAGTLDTSGFASVTLSLAGEVKADFFEAGQVGALLVPDVPTATSAFEDGVTLLSLTVTAPADPGSDSYFAATRPAVPLALPAYRVFFFNTTNTVVEVDLFAYLRN